MADSGNWAGASIEVKDVDKNSLAIKKAEATWVVPRICLPPGGNLQDDYYLATWVGFSGNCSSALLQAGTNVELKADGSMQAKGWVEWYPQGAEFKYNILINPGDTVTVTVEAISNSVGRATIENKNNGMKIVETVQSNNPSNSNTVLCNGPGIAYAFIEKTGKSTNALPRFNSVIFKDFEVTTSKSSQSVNLDDQHAALCDMNGKDASATAERASKIGFNVDSGKGVCTKDSK
ncbi:concanavalin A-like lectin/glucanase [Annulohypoxylon moriforme]|nr:concanavalin A-like lectin/glucanase [Annulohypoxylon moriforme]